MPSEVSVGGRPGRRATSATPSCCSSALIWLLTEACEMPRLSALRRKLRVAHKLANNSSVRKATGKLAIIPPQRGHNLHVMSCHHFAVCCFAARFSRKAPSERENSGRKIYEVGRPWLRHVRSASPACLQRRCSRNCDVGHVRM